MATKTYYVNRQAGLVRRLDDFTLPWINVSNGNQDSLLDVMTVPNLPERVITCGRQRGIWWSNDSGVTWTQSLGDYTTLSPNAEFNEVWIVDQFTSYITGDDDGVMLKSVDGGVTYNLTVTHPTPSGNPTPGFRAGAVHFIDDLVGVVVTANMNGTIIYKTIDGGITWTDPALQTQNVTGPSGIHMSANATVINVACNEGIIRSTDSGLNFIQVLDITSDFPPLGSGKHLTWIDDSTFWITGLENTMRRSTDAGATWSIIRPPVPFGPTIDAAHFTDLNNGFFGNGGQIDITDDSGVTSTLSELNSSPSSIWTESDIPGSIDTLDCVGSILTGVLVENTIATGTTITVEYTGGNAFSYPGEILNSTGVLGLTATLAPGTFNNGSGQLIYTITGTPTSDGIASFAISIGGQDCSIEALVNPLVCYILRSCDDSLYPDINNVQPDAGVNLVAVVGFVISTLDIFGTEKCYRVEAQATSCANPPDLIVLAYTTVGTDCVDFSLLTDCPVEIPLTIVGESNIIEVEIYNPSELSHDFEASFGSCIASGMTILNPNLSVGGNQSGIFQIEYTPTLAENGICEFNVEGPCGTIQCEIYYSAVSIPDCPHFNICITGPTCAPACIMPGEVISFDLGGNIAGIAYPTVVTFQVVDQVTQEVIFNQDYPITSDEDLDNLVINVIAPGPSKYCAEVCLPGCNAKRVLCFDVCEPFDIYKDSCNHWHVHKPETCCDVEEYLVSVTQFNCDTPIVDDVLWNVDQDNTFEFEVPNDGIFIFNMKDPVTGDVIYSFSAFETCALQKCFQIMMDKIMCSCADPCCKKCDGSPEEEREFSRMSLNKLVPLYMTYLGMARRNELYTVGMKLITDEQNCFLHDANQILGKINDIIMDCGCLCPGQENTASNRDGCKTC